MTGILWLCSVLMLRAETTPVTEPLVEEKETLITCEITTAVPKAGVPVFENAKEGEEAKGTYHYKLWLPKGYLADAQKRWPCWFIMSPSGNAKMGAMAARLQSAGVIVVMPQEAKNGPWAPIVGSLLASHDDAVKRVRIMEGQKFATGFSGGARMSGLLAQMRPGFAGLYLQGAGLPPKGAGYHAAGITKIHPFAVAMAVGTQDKNLQEVKRVQAALPGVKFLPLSFEGGHQWAPAETFDKAFDFLSGKAGVPAKGATLLPAQKK